MPLVVLVQADDVLQVYACPAHTLHEIPGLEYGSVNSGAVVSAEPLSLEALCAELDRAGVLWGLHDANRPRAGLDALLASCPQELRQHAHRALRRVFAASADHYLDSLDAGFAVFNYAATFAAPVAQGGTSGPLAANISGLGPRDGDMAVNAEGTKAALSTLPTRELLERGTAPFDAIGLVEAALGSLRCWELTPERALPLFVHLRDLSTAASHEQPAAGSSAAMDVSGTPRMLGVAFDGIALCAEHLLPGAVEELPEAYSQVLQVSGSGDVFSLGAISAQDAAYLRLDVPVEQALAELTYLQLLEAPAAALRLGFALLRIGTGDPGLDAGLRDLLERLLLDGRSAVTIRQRELVLRLWEPN